MRRNLLDKENNFYKEQPNICTFLIEHIFDELEGHDFKFSINNNKFYIDYLDNKNKPKVETSYVDKINGVFVNSIHHFSFDNSEIYLKQIYKL